MIWTTLLKWGIKTVVGRWALGVSVTLILGTVVFMWQSYKAGLRDEGRQECIQAINQETVDQLELALVASRSAVADLIAKQAAAVVVNDEARDRLIISEEKVRALRAARKEQEKTDETYAAWSNTPLPDGVASRLQQLTGGDTSAVRDDSN
jgi:hypothetical protein